MIGFNILGLFSTTFLGTNPKQHLSLVYKGSSNTVYAHSIEIIRLIVSIENNIILKKLFHLKKKQKKSKKNLMSLTRSIYIDLHLYSIVVTKTPYKRW